MSYHAAREKSICPVFAKAVQLRKEHYLHMKMHWRLVGGRELRLKHHILTPKVFKINKAICKEVKKYGKGPPYKQCQKNKSMNGMLRNCSAKYRSIMKSFKNCSQTAYCKKKGWYCFFFKLILLSYSILLLARALDVEKMKPDRGRIFLARMWKA